MDASPKNVREHIARSKFYLQRGDLLRALRVMATALSLLAGSQIFGRERIEIGIMLEEGVRLLGEQDALKRAAPGVLAYKKGQERELAGAITRLADVLESVLEKARQEERRRRLAELDELVLAGQAELDRKDLLEARKHFRRAQDLYGDEPGLYTDLGNRFMLAGQTAEAAEHFQKSIDANQGEPRAFALLAQCLDALGDGARAEDVIRTALRRFGPSEPLNLRLARGALERKAWDEALTNALAALEQNPTSRDGRRLAEAASQHIYGSPQGYLGQGPA